MKTIYNCIICDKALSGKQRSFCSVRCKNEHFQSYGEVKSRAVQRKTKLIALLGKNCIRCGYSASIDALSFYDQRGKTLHINTNELANNNYDKLVKKVRKSQLLCRNCYEEAHNPLLSSRPSLKASGEIPQEILRDSSSKVGMTNELFAQNLTHCGIKQGQTIVLGVSGGMDSMTMLDLFAKSLKTTKLNLVVAHMNHGVRPEAVKDEELVRKMARKHGFKYTSKTIGKPSGGNLEESLRNARREFLLDAANANVGLQGPTLLALAHNANDQAETFIMNALRGSGPAGLGAMSLKDGNIIRPLLNISRSEIETYARGNKLLWNEDASNKDMGYDRNYVRHRILPLLTRLNPDYLNALERTTRLQRQIDSHFKEEALYVIERAKVKAQLPTVIPSERIEPRNPLGGITEGSLQQGRDDKNVSASKLCRLDKPLLYEVLGLMYEEANGNRQNLGLTHLSDIEKMLQNSEGTKTLDLPNEITFLKAYDKLDFYRKKEHNNPSVTSTEKLKVGRQIFGDWEINVSPVIPAKAGIQNKTEKLDSSLRWNDEIIIDAVELPNLIIRTRKPGDKIASIGPTGRKKLQDLFVDAKIDRVARNTWPVVENTVTNEIIWVPKLAKTNIATKSKKLLTINITEVPHETIKEK